MLFPFLRCIIFFQNMLHFFMKRNKLTIFEIGYIRLLVQERSDETTLLWGNFSTCDFRIQGVKMSEIPAVVNSHILGGKNEQNSCCSKISYTRG